MARRALIRAKVKHGAILLVSDLDDAASDEGLLTAEALRLRAEHIPVRIVPLFAAAVDLHFFAALFGQNALVDPSVFTHTAKRHAESVAAPAPWTLLLLGATGLVSSCVRGQRALLERHGLVVPSAGGMYSADVVVKRDSESAPAEAIALSIRLSYAIK